jgi:hypothetical protein
MTDEALVPNGVDRRLSFKSTARLGIHYFVGNPHTFPGRILAFHEDGLELNVSPSEVIEASDFALVWMDGFLAGSEPAPPASDDLKDEEAWQAKRDRYRRTGELS